MIYLSLPFVIFSVMTLVSHTVKYNSVKRMKTKANPPPAILKANPISIDPISAMMRSDLL